MSDDLHAALVAAAARLEGPRPVLEAALGSITALCNRGLAFACAGAEHATLLDAQALSLPPEQLAALRTLCEVDELPLSQRNRWVEPLREGIVRAEGWRASAVGPLLRAHGLLELGGIAACVGGRQVALAGVLVPEGAGFVGRERGRLRIVGAKLVVPLRVAAALADMDPPANTLDALLATSSDAFVALDGAGQVRAASATGREALDADPGLGEQLRRSAETCTAATLHRLRDSVLYMSSWSGADGVDYLAVVDTEA